MSTPPNKDLSFIDEEKKMKWIDAFLQYLIDEWKAEEVSDWATAYQR